MTRHSGMDLEAPVPGRGDPDLSPMDQAPHLSYEHWPKDNDGPFDFNFDCNSSRGRIIGDDTANKSQHVAQLRPELDSESESLCWTLVINGLKLQHFLLSQNQSS